MTRIRYSNRERLAAAALLLLALAVVLGLTVPQAAGNFRAAEQEIAALAARYRDVARRQRDLATLERLRDEFRAADAQRFGILVADTEELARSEIQGMVQEAATATGAVIARIRAINSEDPGQASAAISLRIPADALPEFLLRIADAEPLLFVDSLEIRSDVRRARRQEEVPTTLSVEIAVSAYVTLTAADGG